MEKSKSRKPKAILTFLNLLFTLDFKFCLAFEPKIIFFPKKLDPLSKLGAFPSYVPITSRNEFQFLRTPLSCSFRGPHIVTRSSSSYSENATPQRVRRSFRRAFLLFRGLIVRVVMFLGKVSLAGGQATAMVLVPLFLGFALASTNIEPANLHQKASMFLLWNMKKRHRFLAAVVVICSGLIISATTANLKAAEVSVSSKAYVPLQRVETDKIRALKSPIQPEWWENLQNSAHRNLIIPPQSVKQVSTLDRTWLDVLSGKAQDVGKGVAEELATLQRLISGDSGVLLLEKGDFGSLAFVPLASEDSTVSTAWQRQEVSGIYDLPTTCTPALAFVNSYSGGNQGKLIREELKQLLNPVQVIDISESGQPEKALKQFGLLPRLRLIVAGGDGTVGWVLNSWDKCFNYNVMPPPIAIIPLGTGNDMARSLGWGGGLSGPEGLAGCLKEISEASIAMVDRWNMTIRTQSFMGARAQKRQLSFTNYFSIGVDAQAALSFHETRDSNPSLFFNRMTNKLMYAVLGANEVLTRSCARICDRVELYNENNTKIAIPERAEGIIFLNINSYSGGVNMWDMNPELLDNDISLSPSSKQDRRLDVVAVYGAFHLGQLQVGLAQAEKICQCKKVRLVIKDALPMQVDGEPWVQEESVIRLNCHKKKVAMLQRTESSGGQMAEDVDFVLDWASKKGVITPEQQQELIEQLSERIEARKLLTPALPWMFTI